ncbi:MAG TPA: ribosome biogenesis GTPase Der [Ktedonobacterales bacterium]|nr:ribosome biogenesis GTPase Der [Ktedonobacterales bacterium]
MKPLVAIVGRPNVGKSTLFNKLVGERLAIVEDLPGTTRDRIYADTEWNGRIFTVIDTGGLELGDADNISSLITGQAQLAIEEADVIIFLVDAKSGATEADIEVANLLRRSGKPVVLGANKADNPARRQDAVEFYALGLGEPITLSATSGTGSGDLLDAVTEALPPVQGEEEADEYEGLLRVAIVGRPNVGKSSLVNAILGQERVVVSDIPGTTRDSIDTLVEHKGRQTVLIDTAGIRRRGRVGQGVEKYSVLRSNRAIDRCDVAVLMIDGLDGITAQDTHIAGYIDEAAKGIVIVINKWDLVRERLRAEAELADPDHVVSLEPGKNPVPAGTDETLDAEQYIAIVRERLKFVPYAPVVFASAKTHYHVGPILDHAQQIFETRAIRVATPQLNDVVREAVQRHHPPVVLGRPMRIYYVTQANINPPTFVFFVNDPSLLHFSYERYLENRLRAVFGFDGTAIRMEFRARETTRDDDDGKSHKKRKPAGRRR